MIPRTVWSSVIPAVSCLALMVASTAASGQPRSASAQAVPAQTKTTQTKPSQPKTILAKPADTKPATGPAEPTPSAATAAGSLHAQGKAFVQQREFAKAIEMFSKAIALKSGSAEVWHDRGVAFTGQGEFQLAATDFTKAIELYERQNASVARAESYFERARVLTRLGRRTEALADFERARPFQSDTSMFLAQRALTHWRSHMLDEAMADTSRVLAQNPRSTAGNLARGIRGFVAAERGDHTAAASEFGQLLQAVPDRRTAVAILRSNLMIGRGDAAMSIRIVRNADPACEPNCKEWIAMQGVIERDTDAQFAQVLQRLGGKRLPVFVDSPGGNVEAALAMGRRIRERELDVVTARTEFAPTCGGDQSCAARVKGGRQLGTASDVASLCSSSCVYLLAAGAHRVVGPLSLVGVHQIAFYKIYREPPSEAQLRKDRLEGRVVVSTPYGPRLLGAVKDAAYVQTRTFYRDMDIDDSIMAYLLGAPSDDMHWFSTNELITTRLMTGTGFVGQFFEAYGVAPSVVTVPAPKPSAPATSSADLIEKLHRELVRIGCLSGGGDDKGGIASVRRGLTRYSALLGGNFGDGASQEALDTLRRHEASVCPETCPKGTLERDGYCVKSASPK